MSHYRLFLYQTLLISSCAFILSLAIVWNFNVISETIRSDLYQLNGGTIKSHVGNHSLLKFQIWRNGIKYVQEWIGDFEFLKSRLRQDQSSLEQPLSASIYKFIEHPSFNMIKIGVFHLFIAFLAGKVSKKSPAGGAIVYIAAISIAASFDVYKQSSLEFALVMLLLFCAVSLPLFFINITASIFAILLVHSPYRPKDFQIWVPLSLMIGFYTVLSLDILTRLRGLHLLLRNAKYFLHIYTVFVVMSLVVQHFWGSNAFLTLEEPLSWQQLLSLSCLPDCKRRFATTLPHIFVSLLAILQMVHFSFDANKYKNGYMMAPAAFIGMVLALSVYSNTFSPLHDPRFTCLALIQVTLVSELEWLQNSGNKRNNETAGLIAKERETPLLSYWISTFPNSNFVPYCTNQKKRPVVDSEKRFRINETTNELKSEQEEKATTAGRKLESDLMNLKRARELHVRYQKLAFEFNTMATRVDRKDDEHAHTYSKNAIDHAKSYRLRMRLASKNVAKLKRIAQLSFENAAKFDDSNRSLQAMAID